MLSWTYDAFKQSQVSRNNSYRPAPLHPSCFALCATTWGPARRVKTRTVAVTNNNRHEWTADASNVEKSGGFCSLSRWCDAISYPDATLFAASRSGARSSSPDPVIPSSKPPRELTNAYSRFVFSPTRYNVQQRSFVESLLPHSVSLSRRYRRAAGLFDIVSSKTDSIGIRIPTTQILNFSPFSLRSSVQAHSRTVCILCWFPQRYLVAAEQHLSPEQLFFHSTTTYWVTQSAQPSLAIPLGVPGAHAKSLQLSLPYLLLMSALRYTNPCHYQSPLSHTFKPELFFCLLRDS